MQTYSFLFSRLLLLSAFLMLSLSQVKAVVYTNNGGDPALLTSWDGTPAGTNGNFTGIGDEFIFDNVIPGTAITVFNWNVTGKITIAADNKLIILGTVTTMSLQKDGDLELGNGTLNFSGGGIFPNGGGSAVTGSGIVNVSGTLTVDGQTLNDATTLTVNSGATLTLDGGGMTVNKLINNGDIALNDNKLVFEEVGGTYAGSGTISATAAGVVDAVEVSSMFSSSLTLNSDLSIPTGATLNINGTLLFGSPTTVVTGTGDFNLASGATINLNHAEGLGRQTVTPVLGQIQNTGARTYGSDVNFIFSGIAGQNAGFNLPATISSLTSNVGGTGVLQLASPTLSITTKFEQGTGNSLQTNGCDVTFASGMTITNTNITLTGGGVSTVADKLIIRTTSAAGKTLSFNPATGTNALGLLEIDITAGNVLKLGSNIVIANGDVADLKMASGKLDLNGNNITLLTAVVMQEINLTNGVFTDDAVVFDATATDETNKGGYIEGVGQSFDGATKTADGMGITITDLSANGTSTVVTSIKRYHYSAKHGAGAGVALGIKRIFDIVGTTDNTSLSIEYADSELILANGTFDETQNVHISRWTLVPGWESFAGAGVTLNATANTITMNPIPGFSHWTMSGSLYAPLPITLKTFDVKALENNIAQLNWTTISEISNKGFAIERSYNGTTFAQIAFVEGAGNSNTLQSYKYQDTDANLSAYYRLKQIDFNGTFAYSPLAYYSATGKVLAYPNPVAGKLLFSLPDTDKIIVNLFSGQGKLLVAAQGTAKEVAETLTQYFDTAHNGTYNLQIQYNGKRTLQRLVK